MYEYKRIAMALPRISVGDVEGNTDRILAKIHAAAEEKAEIILFPELCLTGYTCGDLFLQEKLLTSAKQKMAALADATAELPVTILIGLPLIIGGQLYNCAAVLRSGGVHGIVPKTFIPNYAEYYEKRWFSSCVDLKVKAVSALDLGLPISGRQPIDIPVGRDILFKEPDGSLFAVELCEDLWAPLPPSTLAALQGAEMLFNLSASNETISKRDYRRQLVSQQSARCQAVYAYCSAGRTESTTDLIFSGHSLLCENGKILFESDSGVQTEYLLTMDIDLGKIRADRRKDRSFADCASLYAGDSSYRSISLPGESYSSDGSLQIIEKLPFVPSNRTNRRQRCLDIYDMQVAGLQKRMEITGGRPVVGVSGGLDSTLALLVSVGAAKRCGRPVSDVIGITMPCFGTTGRTYNNSIKLMQSLGVTAKNIPIQNAVEEHFQNIGHPSDVLDLTYENAQARERTQVLMDYAGQAGGFVVGTGDLSELALGWCTYNADHMSMYGVNASIPKTLIRWMIDALTESSLFPDSIKVLKDILDTPISPELLPPDESGEIAQKTESIVGPYALHDFFLYYVLRYGFSPSKIYLLACRAFKNDFSQEEIKKWLLNFYRRFFSQQFKRSCLPDGVKVGSVCLSPRGDWRMPSDASAAIWIKEIQSI